MLFQWGDFTLHSGDKSWWRIDCDALTDSEIHLFAKMIAERTGRFAFAISPSSHHGSAAPKLAEALNVYSTKVPEDGRLIVDDVLTTGSSMETLKEMLPEWSTPPGMGYGGGGRGSGHFGPTKGAVLFARGQCPEWITPIFRM